MASTVSTPTLRFNFTALPLEIQKVVLSKYFEDSCTVTFEPRDHATVEPFLKVRLGPEARIILTDKHLFDEAMQAPRISTSTILDFDWDNTKSSVAYPHHDDQLKVFANYAGTIRTMQFHWKSDFSTYLELALKLTTLHVLPECACRDLNRQMQDALDTKNLRSLVAGDQDSYVTTKLRDIMESKMQKRDPSTPSRDLTITFSLSSPIWASWENEVPGSSALEQYASIMWFEMTEVSLTIMNKRFRRFGLSESTPQPLIGATEETLDQLAHP